MSSTRVRASRPVQRGDIEYEFTAVADMTLPEHTMVVSKSRCHVIADRVVRVTLDPEAVAVATKDWGTYFSAGTQFDLVCVVGTATNNIVTVTASCMRIQRSANCPMVKPVGTSTRPRPLP